MSDKTQLENIFNEWETIIADIIDNGISLDKQRALIQCKTKFIVAIGDARKSIKDDRLVLKTNQMSDVKILMEEKQMKKTPAREEVEELSRPARYNLEKLEIDMETMMDIAKNRTYHLRISEIDLNKVWIGVE